MRTIKQTYHINAPVEAVWQALVDHKIINDWGGGPAVMDDKVGTKFKLWGGDINGTNTLVLKHKKLVQDWYVDKWPQASNLQFSLTSYNGHTQVDLLHENVPDAEAKSIEQGWKDSYMGPLKNLVEKEVK